MGGHGGGGFFIFSPPLTPPFCSRSSAVASTNEVTPVPGNISVAATRAAIDEAVLADFDFSDDDDNNVNAAAGDADEEYDYLWRRAEP